MRLDTKSSRYAKTTLKIGWFCMLTRVPGGGIWVPRGLFGPTEGQVINIEDCKIGFLSSDRAFRADLEGQNRGFVHAKSTQKLFGPVTSCKERFCTTLRRFWQVLLGAETLKTVAKRTYKVSKSEPNLVPTQKTVSDALGASGAKVHRIQKAGNEGGRNLFRRSNQSTENTHAWFTP